METVLVKMFATALALSQVTTAPDDIATRFDRDADRGAVAQLLRAGCTHMRKAFDIEDINLDDLIATAMDDPQAIAGESKAFRGIDFADLATAYRQFCATRSWRRRTSASTSITASTSAGSSAPSSAISRIPAAPRAARPSPSSW